MQVYYAKIHYQETIGSKDSKQTFIRDPRVLRNMSSPDMNVQGLLKQRVVSACNREMPEW